MTLSMADGDVYSDSRQCDSDDVVDAYVYLRWRYSQIPNCLYT